MLKAAKFAPRMISRTFQREILEKPKTLRIKNEINTRRPLHFQHMIDSIWTNKLYLLQRIGLLSKQKSRDCIARVIVQYNDVWQYNMVSKT